jgi:hypothetical protein
LVADGQTKARFFLGLGFHPDQWQQLADALRFLETVAVVSLEKAQVRAVDHREVTNARRVA